MTGRRAATASAFRAGHARAARWQDAVEQALDGVGEPPPGANLGFVYVSDRLDGPRRGRCSSGCAKKRASQDWIGSVGVGVLASGVEYFDEPAVSVMLGALPGGRVPGLLGEARGRRRSGAAPRAARRPRTSRSFTATRTRTTCRS